MINPVVCFLPELPWRNRLARSAVNRKVAGSSPDGADNFVKICILPQCVILVTYIRALARAPVATSDLLICNFLLKIRPEMSKFYELAREPLYKL